MSYNFGQFRSSQMDGSFSNDIKNTFTLGWKNTSEDNGVIFSNVNATGNVLQNQKYYYLRFHVAQEQENTQKFSLKLSISDTQDEEHQQTIEDFTVNTGTGIQYFQIIIAPNATYNQILWQLKRTYIDYTSPNSRGTTGRLMDIQVDELTILENVVTFLGQQVSDEERLKSLKKIGVQGPPSLLMCINGEQIRIGKSGIYEITNPGIAVSFIGFVPKTNEDYFIMDFEY